MLIKSNVSKSSGRFKLYNLYWPGTSDPLAIERSMIRKGGTFKKQDGEEAGAGLYHHFRKFQELCWPDKIWENGPFKNYWAEKCLEVYISHTYIGVMGCAACVRGDTKILNPVTGESPTIKSLCSTGTAPVVMTAFGAANAGIPFVKGTAKLYEVVMQSGRKFTGTMNHTVLGIDGEFCRVSDLRAGQLLIGCEPSLPGTISDNDPKAHASDVHHSYQKASDFQSYYQSCPCLHDGQLLQDEVPGQYALTSPDDAPEHISSRVSWNSDGQDSKPECSHSYQYCAHPSSCDFYSQGRLLETSLSHLHAGETILHALPSFRPPELSKLTKRLLSSYEEPPLDYVRYSPWDESALPPVSGILAPSSQWSRSYNQSQWQRSQNDTNSPPCFHSSNMLNLRASCSILWVEPDAVASVKFIGCEEFYDLQVPHFHHYYADGFIHHNSGKSDSFGCHALTDWYCFDECTSVLVSSTDLKSLELRIWGMIKKYHKLAKAERDWIPGHLIEGKQMIIQDPRMEASEGRDFKSGLIGIPCRKGNQFTGLSTYAGIHNKRVRVIGDELQLMPRALLDSIANLAKCENFKFVGMGNPNETTNAHGIICEPSPELGGWESGVDQHPGTKTWPTRFPNGICLQLPGSDSPNMKAEEGQPDPFPFLITRKQLHDDASIWGRDDWHFQMMDEGRMPRGQGSRRVLTRQACVQFGAFKPPIWRDTRRTSIAFLDAAYRGVGGDRCVFGELQFGHEAVPVGGSEIITNLISQDVASDRFPKILALIDLTIVPISAGIDGQSPEDQIVAFCKNQCEARNIPPENLFFDAGMRTSLVTAFCRLWSTAVNSVDCGGRPSETTVSSEIKIIARDYYSKFVTELWFSVRYAVESRQFRGMTEEACTEFGQREWKMVSGNKIEIESKEEMKTKTGRSPDLADAIAVGVYGARRRGFIISKMIPEEEVNPKAPSWKVKYQEQARELAQSGQLTYT